MNARDRALAMMTRHEAAQLRRENGFVRAVLAGYEQARVELLAELQAAYERLGPDPEAAAVRRLANDAQLIRAIERRIDALQTELATLVQDHLSAISQAASEGIFAEIATLAEGLGVTSTFPFTIDALLEMTVVPALEQVPGLSAQIRANLLQELRVGLARGDRFSDLARRLVGREGSVFARGKTSAELMVRRAVIEANNSSRLITLEESRTQIPGLQKQAVAALGPSTTELCLRVHGQIQDVDKPFELGSGPPEPFAPKMMASPFHWNCRTAVAPYHPDFERTSNVTTAAMRAAAQEALANRS